jgi:hypothetical protein
MRLTLRTSSAQCRRLAKDLSVCGEDKKLDVLGQIGIVLASGILQVTRQKFPNASANT